MVMGGEGRGMDENESGGEGMEGTGWGGEGRGGG
jgi:hypothetical protein